MGHCVWDRSGHFTNDWGEWVCLEQQGATHCNQLGIWGQLLQDTGRETWCTGHILTTGYASSLFSDRFTFFHWFLLSCLYSSVDHFSLEIAVSPSSIFSPASSLHSTSLLSFASCFLSLLPSFLTPLQLSFFLSSLDPLCQILSLPSSLPYVLPLYLTSLYLLPCP